MHSMQCDRNDYYATCPSTVSDNQNTNSENSVKRLFYSNITRFAVFALILIVSVALLAVFLTLQHDEESVLIAADQEIVPQSSLMTEVVYEVAETINPNNKLIKVSPPYGSSLIHFFEDFVSYSTDYKKTHDTLGEKILRFSTYVKSRALVDHHNSQNFTYTIGINQFSDRTNYELKMFRGIMGDYDTPDILKDKVIDDELLKLKLISNASEWSNLYTFIQDFDEFVDFYNKPYSNLSEKADKFKVFSYNSIKINHHNFSNSSYTMAVNQFADLTQEEFKQLMLTSRLPSLKYHELEKILMTESSSFVTTPLSVYNWFTYNQEPLPDSIDWVQKGCVSKVKNQGKCGSCWAFSASGAVEGAYCAKHHILRDLSEQQLVDCAEAEGNRGCNGGNVDRAFLYMIKEKGLCTEAAYPYKGKGEHCHSKKCEAQVIVKMFVDVPRHDEKSVMAALVEHSPVSVGVDADGWQFYEKGIFDGPCKENLNHEVLIVGYGTENKTTDYWYIKNSWGENWGQKGYMKIKRNVAKKSGLCGILDVPVFPIVY